MAIQKKEQLDNGENGKDESKKGQFRKGRAETRQTTTGNKQEKANSENDKLKKGQFIRGEKLKKKCG